MPKPFVFNDQNQANSYGFRILTAGISLKRFNKNPIMLNQHWNSTSNVLGKWENLKVEKDLLLGEPVFDVADEEALKVSGKVDRGFINSCSMGITFKREDLKIIGTELIMEKCELYECSIVAVPSNANSIRLYAENGELLKDDEVKQLCLSLQPVNELETPNENQTLEFNTIDMKKITLSLAVLTALSFDKATPEVDVETVEAAVLKLSNENATLKAEKLKLEAANESAKAQAIEDWANLSVKEGRINEPQKQHWVDLANNNFELAKTTMATIPAKVTLSDKVVPGATTTVATKADFQKLSLDEQLAFKTNNQEEYKKMFNLK